MSDTVRTRADDLDAASLPPTTDRGAYEADVARLRLREKALTHAADEIAAARRRLPMVEVDGTLPLLGPHGTTTLLDAFEGRRQLLAYYFMWWPGQPAQNQCEGCTYYVNQVAEPSSLHSRDITFAVLMQGRNTTYGPEDAQSSYDASLRYREFMGWTMPWYSAQSSLEELLPGRELGLFHLVSYVREDNRVYETYWTERRGVQAMDYGYALMDLTVWGRQEAWEDSPDGWPQDCSNVRTETGAPAWTPTADWGGRPVGQWTRVDAGYDDDLGVAGEPDGAAPQCH
jgi:predicted dithiol-disulfide oxidoreductase (DUF899 family)